MILDEAIYLDHSGVKGMRWGQRRKAKKEAKKVEQAAAYKKFSENVLKDIGSRSPSELYSVRGNQGNLIMTGGEFVQRANTGMTFTSIQSTGMQINDGR